MATARERYLANRNEIVGLVARLQRTLADHERAAEQRPNDWGFVGDVADVAVALREIVEPLEAVER